MSAEVLSFPSRVPVLECADCDLAKFGTAEWGSAYSCPSCGEQWTPEQQCTYTTIGGILGGIAQEIEEGRSHVALRWARDCAEAWANVPVPDDEES
ncbi:hypothetical protein [Saccharopolyspora sp. 6V]|uniref:hypothetical protein n=1 Tax=Saccharopolyspora sp. 6V TaxID=2877239 RepID=UPI001CD253CD|nr:hypothetical protein [Saccharopolyspora sp. 6V]MCA1191673.1 hypothetical protein [Saccharopolyspora sp. 6V]